MDIEQEYQKTLDYLYSFVDYSQTRQLVYSNEKFNLDRMTQLLEIMDNPQQAYKVVHVTGTKGKGSVSAFCASAIQHAGLKVGLYTSPHLIDYNERIQVNGEPIPHEKMVALVDKLKLHIARVEEITTFEISTAMAFQYFADEQVDYAVVEVGLGGRLDATNVVDPVVSVITTISYDHQAILGSTLAEIAAEKAGIIKPGRPVVIAAQTSEAQSVVTRIAEEMKSSIIQVGRDILHRPVEHNLEHQKFQIWSSKEQGLMDRYIEEGEANGWEPKSFDIPLLGAHQLDNAATAFAALTTLQHIDKRISNSAIARGFNVVEWPCRFEIISRRPMVILDSAHNRDSAQKLRLTLDDYLPGRGVVLLFGASEDKDVVGMLMELMPRVDQVIATQSIHPRALEAGKIVEYAHRMGKKAHAVIPLESAFNTALQLANDNHVVLAAGSIFLAAAIKELWMKQHPDIE